MVVLTAFRRTVFHCFATGITFDIILYHFSKFTQVYLTNKVVHI